MTCALLGLVGIGQWIAALRAVQYGESYVALGVSFWPGLLVLGDAFWGVMFVWSGWRLWSNRNGSSRLVFLVIGAFATYQVIWWFLFYRADHAQTRLPFAILMLGVLVSLAVWAITRQRR